MQEVQKSVPMALRDLISSLLLLLGTIKDVFFEVSSMVCKMTAVPKLHFSSSLEAAAGIGGTCLLTPLKGFRWTCDCRQVSQYLLHAKEHVVKVS